MGVLVPLELVEGLSNEAKRAAGCQLSSEYEEERVEGQIPTRSTNHKQEDNKVSESTNVGKANLDSENENFIACDGEIQLDAEEKTQGLGESCEKMFLMSNMETEKKRTNQFAKSLRASNARAKKTRKIRRKKTELFIKETRAEEQKQKIQESHSFCTTDEAAKSGFRPKEHTQGEINEWRSSTTKEKPKEAESLAGCEVDLSKRTSRTPAMVRHDKQDQLLEAVSTRTRPAKRNHSGISSSSSSTSAAVNVNDSPAHPLETSRSKRPRHKSFLRESSKTNTLKASNRVAGTCTLESDDETQENEDDFELRSPQSSKLKSSTVDRTSAKKVKDASTPGCCVFRGCTSPACYRSRCEEHFLRRPCAIPKCSMSAQSGGKCFEHGGGALCTEDGCDRHARTGGKCYVHGGGAICSHPRCATRARMKGKCVLHGGGKLCSETGCTKLVKANGKCIAHGERKNCMHPGCEKLARVRQLCDEHEYAAGNKAELAGGEKPKSFRSARSKPSVTSPSSTDERSAMRIKTAGVSMGKSIASTKKSVTNERVERIYVKKVCSYPDCSKWTQWECGGKCVEHGGGTPCPFPGCSKRMLTKGKCYTHGGDTRCSLPACHKVAISRGRCDKHALDGGKCLVKGQCRRHGGYPCSKPGCTNYTKKKGEARAAHRGGLQCTDPECTQVTRYRCKCAVHTGANACSYPECTNKAARSKSMCSAHVQGVKCSFPRKPIWANTKCYDHSQPGATLPRRTRSQRTANLNPRAGLEVNELAKARTRTAEATEAKLPVLSHESAAGKTGQRTRATKDSKATTRTGRTEKSAVESTATAKAKCVDRPKLSESDEFEQSAKSTATDGKTAMDRNGYVMSSNDNPIPTKVQLKKRLRPSRQPTIESTSEESEDEELLLTQSGVLI